MYGHFGTVSVTKQVNSNQLILVNIELKIILKEAEFPKYVGGETSTPPHSTADTLWQPFPVVRELGDKQASTRVDL